MTRLETDPSGADPRARWATQVRRRLQPLWSALDAHLGPHRAGGLLLAVSGGRDSRALLEAAARWPARDAGPLEVASVDHGQRPQSGAEAAWVAGRAHLLGFEAAVLELGAAPGAGEGTLRALRYAALAHHLAERGLAATVTAHQADDDAEGLLLDLLGQGGGRGGAAMAARTELEGLVVLRPFLGLRRTTLELATTTLGVRDRFVDPADQRGAGRRARVRQAIGPLEALHPDLGERALAWSRRRREDEDALAALARASVRPQEQAGGLLLVGEAGPPAALWRRAVVEACRRLSGKDPRGAAPTLDALVAAAASGRRASFDLAGLRAETSPAGVWLGPARPPA